MVINHLNQDNLILATDSYKLNHWNQYPSGTQTVYSYMESRQGAAHPYTLFFGLQYLLKEYLSEPISWEDIDQASKLVSAHLGPGRFNYQGWAKIKENHGGYLPLRIKAVPEGLVIPTGNVLMTVENTDPEFFWLTNAVESLLTHVWYPTTVATRSYATKQMLKHHLEETAGGDLTGLPFMLHDFGYRGVSSHESAGIGGAAHLVNFVGTDTVPAMLFAQKYYDAALATLAFSVPATEHSIMTSMGEDGEHSVVEQLLDKYPDGILSVVADSYDIYRFVNWLGTDFKERILNRDGVFVVRPDSTTGKHREPEDLVVWIAQTLWHYFGGSVTPIGDMILDPHIRILWGDGIEPNGIEKILDKLALHGFSAANMAAFGMGGGLLQKVNRDTERFAFKSSAQERDGVWYDIFKNAPGKESKKGRLQLSRWTDENNENPRYVTLTQGDHVGHTMDLRVRRDGEDRRTAMPDILETVFEDGKIVKEYTFEEVRANSEK